MNEDDEILFEPDADFEWALMDDPECLPPACPQEEKAAE